MKRFAFSIIGLVIACSLSAFIALVSFGAIEGVAVSTGPEACFGLIAPLACPGGVLDYQEVHASFNLPGENQFTVDCIFADGSRADITLKALGYITALSYLACFVPLCIFLGLIGFFVPLVFVRLRKKDALPGKMETG